LKRVAQKSGKDRERKKNKSWAAGVQHFQLPPTKSDRKRKNPIDTHIQHKSNEDKKTEELDHEEGTKKKYRKTGWGGEGTRENPYFISAENGEWRQISNFDFMNLKCST